MKKVGLVYDDVFLKHETPAGHPESKERLTAIMDALRASDLWDRLVHLKPRKAAFPQIEAVHTHAYVEKIRKMGHGYADMDTYLSPGSLEAAQFAAGAVIEAIERCKRGEIERAFCAVRPPGHHAEADRAMGFCIFNNVAVGARHAQQAGYKRVFIVDFDVHHGNGTQHIFEEDDTVFYFSTHQYPHYPGTGSHHEKGKGKGDDFTANYPMPHGAGDREFYLIYGDVLLRMVKKFSPDIMLVSAGYDLHYRDPLASLRVTEEGIRMIVASILMSAPVPAVFCLEGGYDLKALADSVLLTVRLLMEAG